MVPRVRELENSDFIQLLFKADPIYTVFMNFCRYTRLLHQSILIIDLIYNKNKMRILSYI